MFKYRAMYLPIANLKRENLSRHKKRASRFFCPETFAIGATSANSWKVEKVGLPVGGTLGHNIATTNIICLRLSQDENNHNPQNAVSLRVMVNVMVMVMVSWNAIWHFISMLASPMRSKSLMLFHFYVYAVTDASDLCIHMFPHNPNP